jgi:hypothetical protein
VDEPENPAFDEVKAAESIGRRVLVGINLTREGQIIDMRQLVGEVVSAGPSEGIKLLREDGGDYWLPPDTDSLVEADPGTYNLHTGGAVTDPDYISTWTIDLAEGQSFPDEGFHLP